MLFSLVMLSASVGAQPLDNQYNWALKRDRDGIKVYTARVEGSKYKAVAMSMLIAARVESLVGLVADTQSCTSWVAMCKSAKVLAQLSHTESYVYNVTNLPFPLRDRDMVARLTWQRDPATGVIIMRSRAVKNYRPERKGIVRVSKGMSNWVFTPKENGKVLVQSYAHLDPNGPVPAWIVNRLIVNAPFKTMRNMQRIIEDGGYADYQLQF